MRKKLLISIGCIVSILIFLTGIIFVKTPSIVLAEGEYVIEAGDAFDPEKLIESYRFGKKGKVTIDNPVKTDRPGTYKVTFTAGIHSLESIVQVVDRTAPSLELIEAGTVLSVGDDFDFQTLIKSATDITGVNKVDYLITEGNLNEIGEVTIEVTAQDAYGNCTKKSTRIMVQDGAAPVLILSEKRLEAELGDAIDILSYVADVEDNHTAQEDIVLSYEIVEGDLKHAGDSIVEIMATDASGNTAKEQINIRIIDNEPPQLTMKKSPIRMLIDKKFSAWDVVASANDNDEIQGLTYEVIKGNIEVIGESVIRVTATDKSGNTATGEAIVVRKDHTYNALGWDVTGKDNQPYLVGVNRTTGVVTVYGKDEEGDYVKPVIAFDCSVGRAGCETITGRYTTTQRYVWRLLIDDTYGRYAIRIHGGFLFHSVPYYSMNIDDLEWPEYNKLGSPASAGCVRMAVEDVLWLYNNCPTGFETIIYDAPSDPIATRGHKEIDVLDETTRGWDPTDPSPLNPWK